MNETTSWYGAQVVQEPVTFEAYTIRGWFCSKGMLDYGWRVSVSDVRGNFSSNYWVQDGKFSAMEYIEGDDHINIFGLKDVSPEAERDVLAAIARWKETCEASI